MTDVAIYQIDRGFPLWVWLCRPCLSGRKDEGWEVKDRKTPPHALTCDGCHFKGQP